MTDKEDCENCKTLTKMLTSMYEDRYGSRFFTILTSFILGLIGGYFI